MQVERLIDEGTFSSTDVWEKIEEDILQAIRSIQWPEGSGSFTLYPQAGKKRGEGNGVVPIKKACMLHLESKGWVREQELSAIDTGDIDAAYTTEKGLYSCSAFEERLLLVLPFVDESAPEHRVWRVGPSHALR